MKNMKDIVREQFSLINIRPKVEKIMEDHNLHMEDIDVIGNSQSIYDGAPEEFFSMLEFYYVGIGEEAVMFEIRFKDGSRIYTDYNRKYNLVSLHYEMAPKYREKISWKALIPKHIVWAICSMLKDDKDAEEVLKILGLLPKTNDVDQ